MEVGPFCVHSIDTTSIGFSLNSSSDYSIDLDSIPLAGKVIAISGNGKLSPWSPVTMPGADRQVAKIPLSAVRFAFGYPLDGAQCPSPDDLMDGHVASCVLGFYVYLDEQGAACGMSGLSHGEPQLFFMGPFKLWTLRVPGLRKHLHEDGVYPAKFVSFLYS